jgi:hypothetical protein
MVASTLTCPKCKTEFEAAPETGRQECSCPNCAAILEAFFFPAFFRERPVEAPAAMLIDQTEACCFYHPQKQAAQVCEGCGRLICSLCSIQLGQEHLCPTCISAGKRKGKIAALENSRTCYDKVALSVSILGIVFYIFSIVTAPIVIYLVIRHWNSPGSVLGVSRTRFIIALVLALVELGGWITVAALVIINPK